MAAVIVDDLPQRKLAAQLCGAGLRFRTGPFSVCLRSRLAGFAETWARAYGSLPVLPDDAVCHFRIEVDRRRGVSRIARSPQAVFRYEGETPFDPYPLDHAFPLYEWGLNWVTAQVAHDYLLLHSAVVEKGGFGLLLPALPGSGKSTLCAGLVSRGWRLLSDEFAIIRPSDGQLLPLPRVAPLKNESIEVLRAFAPGQRFGPRYDRTRKGTVVHLLPPVDSLQRQHEPARPRWVVFPRYRACAETQLTVQPASLALARLVNNSFNYRVTAETGFRAVCSLVRDVECYELINGCLGDAVAQIDRLAAGRLDREHGA